MRRATRGQQCDGPVDRISIHALREESDWFFNVPSMVRMISIHALREESDQGFEFQFVFEPEFQSTLSVRRATRARRWPTG